MRVMTSFAAQRERTACNWEVSGSRSPILPQSEQYHRRAFASAARFRKSLLAGRRRGFACLAYGRGVGRMAVTTVSAKVRPLPARWSLKDRRQVAMSFDVCPVVGALGHFRHPMAGFEPSVAALRGSTQVAVRVNSCRV